MNNLGTNTPAQLANRFREVTFDGKWIANTNLKDQVSNVSLEQAITKIGTLNSIAALTFHIGLLHRRRLNVFEGGDLEIRDKYSFDLPAMKSQEDWDLLKQKLWDDSERFANHVESMSEEKLDKNFVREEYGSYRRKY